MKRVLLCVLLCAAAARAEIKERIAAIGRERVQVMRPAPGLQGDKDRAGLLPRGLTELVDEKLREGEATPLGLVISGDGLRRALGQLARQQGMELADFRQALDQQGIP